MARIGILSVSDGRPRVHHDIEQYVMGIERGLASVLRARGHEVSCGAHILWTNELATVEARRMADWRPDLTIINISVWAFPHFSSLAARTLHGPLLLLSGLDPRYPGMVGMLAAAGALDQVGRKHLRAWGDIRDPAVLESVETAARAAAAASALEGLTFGRIGGRPMGMSTAVANTDQWMREFGIDVEEIDEWELVRRSESVSTSRVKVARTWLESKTACVHYDGKQLTPELLERQIRTYYVMRELIDEWRLDFCGIKAQPELTTHFCTTDVAEAFLNDPYDWEGPKSVHVCATEADMDGALSMELLRRMSGTPVLFSDLRHYHAAEDLWHLSNSGQHATWFAARSEDPDENMRHVHLYPQSFYFPAGGAAVHHLAAPGDFTFARLTRSDGAYRMHVLRGEIEVGDDEKNESLMRQATYEWPHAFARIDAEPATILGRYASNHIHAVPGDYVTELRQVCYWLGIDFDPFGSASSSRPM